MTNLYIDIETLPAKSPATQERITANMKAPANYKKPEAISKWMEDNRETEIRKTSFSGMYGAVYCVGYAINDNPAEIITGDELSVLQSLSTVVNDYAGHVFIGHYIREFDLPFLQQRMMINGVKPLFQSWSKKWDQPVRDTHEIFAAGTRGHYKLDDICYAMNIPTPKTGVDGSQVYDFYLAGRHQEVYDYCKRDVEATREVFKKLTLHEKK